MGQNRKVAEATFFFAILAGQQPEVSAHEQD
jgi:hypothetical protein